MKRIALFGTTAAIAFTAMIGLAFAAALSVDSDMAALLDNPAAKAVLAKYLPDLIANPQLDQARGVKLIDLKQYVPALDDAMVKKINEDLAKIK